MATSATPTTRAGIATARSARPARGRWLEARASDLLPVEYFHVVFTVPPQIAAISLQNKRVMYGILFRAVSETLLQIAADPKHLGARIGFLAVPHTWSQTLLHHPHVHCVVPGGGLSEDGAEWVSCPRGFFLPVKVLGRVFRGKFLEHTRRAFAEKMLSFHGTIDHLQDPDRFHEHLEQMYANDWVIYAKKPFGGPAQVLKFLACYTHRVAISNHRLVSLEDGRVRFRYRDSARGNRSRTMELDAVEFMRRFLLHVLPGGFVRIRHYGLLANTHRQDKIARCRELIGDADPPLSIGASPTDGSPAATEDDGRCPACGAGTMVTILVIPRPSRRSRPWLEPQPIDSS